MATNIPDSGYPVCIRADKELGRASKVGRSKHDFNLSRGKHLSLSDSPWVLLRLECEARLDALGGTPSKPRTPLSPEARPPLTSWLRR